MAPVAQHAGGELFPPRADGRPLPLTGHLELHDEKA